MVDEGRVESRVEVFIERQHARNAWIEGDAGKRIMQRVGCAKQRRGLRRRCGDQQPAGLQSLARLEFQAPLAIEIEGRHPLLEATVQLCGKLAADRIHARYCNESRDFFRVAVSLLVADDREPGPPGLNQPGIAPLLQLPTECRAARGEVLGTVIEAGAGASAHRTSAARPSGFLREIPFCRKRGSATCWPRPTDR